MRRIRPRGLAVLGALLLAVGGGAAAPTDAAPAGRVRVGKPRRLRVTHVTRVAVPAGTARLQVWHAKPLPRAWVGLPAPSEVERATLSPEGAAEVATRSPGAVAWKWDLRAPAAGPVECVSTFELVSADRDLETSGLVVRWADVAKGAAEAMRGLPELPAPTARLTEVFEDVRKKRRDAVDGIVGFTQWIRAHVAHRGGVPYRSDDVDAILRGGAGHCGHRATVFLALCRAGGIAARRVVGFSLDNAKGLLDGREDPNRHVWAEVHLPGVGWVEVEPSPTGSPFAIPSTRVMNPPDLQSCSVEAVSESGAGAVPPYEDTVRVAEAK